jgi:hypothetical protein
LSIHLRLVWISHQHPICIPLLPHSCYIPCRSHPPWLDHSNYTWRKIQVMKKCLHLHFLNLKIIFSSTYNSGTNFQFTDWNKTVNKHSLASCKHTQQNSTKSDLQPVKKSFKVWHVERCGFNSTQNDFIPFKSLNSVHSSTKQPICHICMKEVLTANKTNTRQKICDERILKRHYNKPKGLLYQCKFTYFIHKHFPNFSSRYLLYVIHAMFGNAVHA